MCLVILLDSECSMDIVIEVALCDINDGTLMKVFGLKVHQPQEVVDRLLMLGFVRIGIVDPLLWAVKISGVGRFQLY